MDDTATNGTNDRSGAAQPGAGPSSNAHSGWTSPPNYAQQHFAQNHALQEQLRRFWGEMSEDVQKTGTDPLEFKSQQLPLARIKKIMKSDEDVRMISAEAPVLFAKACEFFILEMTLRAWNAAEEHKRRTLQRTDIATAISRTEVWDFLLDTVPLEEGAAPGGVPPVAGAHEGGGAGGSGGSGGGGNPSMAAFAVQQQQQQQQQFIAQMGQIPAAGMMPPGMVMPPGAMFPPSGMFLPPGAAGNQYGMQMAAGVQVPGMDPKQEPKEEAQ